MPKIHILDKNTSNLIAAGEVIERPSSVVKELFENSIDSGANSITVEIEDGGIKKIEITDDGCGIHYDDVKTAFLPHATSKINIAKDLENIQTLGFRGEALASIACVSEVTMNTKPAKSDIGVKIVLSGGEIQSFEEYACNTGTKITVNNLFFNVPARRKFLAKPKVEEKHITKLVEQFMLSKPNIKVKYIVDGKIIYNTTGSGLYDNIYSIYGENISENLIPIDFEDGEFKLKGYIGNYNISKPNRTYEIFFINGRIIKDFVMENAVQFAYDNFLMKGNFPVCFLNFEVPFDFVDVNVHPSKQQVKFQNIRLVHSFINNAIKTVLCENQSQTFDSIFETKTNIEKADEQKFISSFKSDMTKLTSDFGSSFKGETVFKSDFQPVKEVYLDTSNDVSVYSQNNDVVPNIDDCFKQFEMFNHEQDNQYKLIGTLFSTYIILQLSDKILVIDQHALHERKLYDSFIDAIDNNELSVQTLIAPYAFSCNSEEAEIIFNNLDVFSKLGFEICEFGHNIFKITQVPFLMKDINLSEFVDDIIKNLSQYAKDKKSLVKDYLAKTACRTAVKGGDSLSTEEIDLLLKGIRQNKILQCPHGRPVVFEVTRKEIEKRFKRIL